MTVTTKTALYYVNMPKNQEFDVASMTGEVINNYSRMMVGVDALFPTQADAEAVVKAHSAEVQAGDQVYLITVTAEPVGAKQ